MMSRAAASRREPRREPCRKNNTCWHYHTYLLHGGEEGIENGTNKDGIKCHFPHAPPCRKQGHCHGRPEELGGSGACTYFHYIPAPPARGGGGGGAREHVTPQRSMTCQAGFGDGMCNGCPPGTHARAAPGAPARPAAGGAGASSAAQPLLQVDLPEHWGDADLVDRRASKPACKALHEEFEAAAAPAPPPEEILAVAQTGGAPAPQDIAGLMGALLSPHQQLQLVQALAALAPAQPAPGRDVSDLQHFGTNPALQAELERLYATAFAAGAAAASGKAASSAEEAIASAKSGIVVALVHALGYDEDDEDDEE